MMNSACIHAVMLPHRPHPCRRRFPAIEAKHSGNNTRPTGNPLPLFSANFMAPSKPKSKELY
jgi:hypothetical protein